jgi:hypothetical protein
MCMDMLCMDVAWTRTCCIGMSMLHQHGRGPVLTIDSTKPLPYLLYCITTICALLRLPRVNKTFFIYFEAGALKTGMAL